MYLYKEYDNSGAIIKEVFSQYIKSATKIFDYGTFLNVELRPQEYAKRISLLKIYKIKLFSWSATWYKPVKIQRDLTFKE